MNRQKGFIQIPILIAVIVGVLVVGGASFYVGVQQYQNYQAEKIQQQEIATENEQTTKTGELSEVEKLRQEIEKLKQEQIKQQEDEEVNTKIQIYQPLTPSTPPAIKAEFIKECESRYEVIESEALNPVSLIEIKRDLAQKVCAEGGSYDRMESFWFCEDRVSYVQTLNSFVDYCVDWKMGKLNQ